jgi:hypothetical protein
MVAGCGEVLERGHVQALVGSELSGMPVGYCDELVICRLAGDVESKAVVGAAGHGVTEIFGGKATREYRDLGQVPQQPTPLVGSRVSTQGVLRQADMGGDRGEQGGGSAVSWRAW